MSYSNQISNVYRSCATGLLILFLSLQCRAQYLANNFTVSFLTTKDGLSQATNRYMLHDSKGYMWISSQDGINRYNGKDFLHFSDPRFYDNCKPFKQVYGIVEDLNGDIWVGTKQGLYKYQQSRYKFRKYDVFINEISNDRIALPFAVKGNEVWFSDGGLSFKAIDCTTQEIRTLYEVPVSSYPGLFSTIVPQTDDSGNIWLVQKDLIYKINVRDKTLEKFSIFPTKGNLTGNISVAELSLHNDSRVLAIATGKGLVLFDTKKNKAIAFTDKERIIKNTDCWYVKADRDCFLVSNDKYPLIKIGLDGSSVIPLVNKKMLGNNVYSGSSTRCIYKDKWNRVWLNANGAYIAILDYNPLFIKRVAKGEAGGLPVGTVLSIASTDNFIWVSDTYLSVINRRTGKVEKIFLPGKLQGHPHSIYQLFYDAEMMRVWLTAGADLYYYDLSMARFVKPDFQLPGSSNIDYVRCFVKLKNGNLLLVRSDGVYKLDKDGKEGQFIKEFGNAGIIHLCKLSGSRFALSMIGQPLKIFQYDDQFNLRLIRSIAIEASLTMVSEDDTNRFILAATEQGVYKISNTSYNIIRRYTTADGMTNDFIYGVIPDKFGWAWCSTNKGIVAINTSNDNILNFERNQNIQDLEFNNRAFTSDRDGYIYFGGVKGLNYFKPPFIDEDSIKPRIVIEEVFLNNAPYLNYKNPDSIGNISFSYGSGALSMKVLALHLLKGPNLKIRYRLKGQQDDWIEIGNGENIQMYKLAAGNYELEISYTDGSRTNTFPVRIISIKVLPPWYRTWWTQLLAILLVIAVGWFIINWRQKRKLIKLKQENEIITLKAEQQLIVARERERITADLHDEVGATLSSIHVYSSVANKAIDKDTQKAKEALQHINENTRYVMEKMNDIVWAMNTGNAGETLMEGKLKNYGYDLLSPLNIACNYKIDKEADRKISNIEAKKNILLIAKEAMNNIAKYSGANGAVIQLTMNGPSLELTISDNGKGFEEAEGMYGNGLRNMKQRASAMGGICTIVSQREHGTLVHCKIPLTSISD